MRMNGSSSHVRRGRPPAMRRNISTGMRFSPRLKLAVSTVESGIASRREFDLADEVLSVITARTEAAVDSVKNWKSTIPSSSATGSGQVSCDVEHLR